MGHQAHRQAARGSEGDAALREHLGPALQRALEALELARWDDLPDAALPWPEVSAEARRQGVSEADVVWDLCGRHTEPPAPKRKRKGKGAPRKTPS